MEESPDDASTDEEDDVIANRTPVKSSPWRRSSWDSLSIASTTGTPTVKFNKLSRSQPNKLSGVQTARKRLTEENVKVLEKQAETSAIHDSTVDKGCAEFKDEMEEDDDDIEFLFTQPAEGVPKFSPLSTQTCLKICKLLKLEVNHELLYKEMAVWAHLIKKPFGDKFPSVAKTISGDGNCYFRALSWCLTGSQKFHGVLRDLICNYIENPKNAAKLNSKIRPDTTKEEHVKKMRRDRVWATEVEIFASAYLLKQDIWVYLSSKDGMRGWLPHRASGNNKNKTRQCIFLLNHACHFEPCMPKP